MERPACLVLLCSKASSKFQGQVDVITSGMVGGHGRDDMHFQRARQAIVGETWCISAEEPAVCTLQAKGGVM